MRVVIGTDDKVVLSQLQSILSELGHEYWEVTDAFSLYDTCAHEQPEVVFVAESYLTTNHIDELNTLRSVSKHENFVVILIANVGQWHVDVEEVVTLPLNQELIRAKIDSAMRINKFTRGQIEHFRTMEKEALLMSREVELTQRMLKQVTEQFTPVSQGMKTFSRPKLQVSGDVAVSSVSADGSQIVLVGDVTGHGLSSATTVMAIQSIFFDEITHKENSLERLAVKINNRLNTILPDEMFFTAAFIRVDANGCAVEIWNAAMPEVLVLNTETRSATSFESCHMPLGIASLSEADIKVSRLDYQDHQQIYLFSDGFTEYYEDYQRCGNMRELIEWYAKSIAHQDIFSQLIQDFNSLMAEHEVSDDVTIVEVIPSQLHKLPQ